MNPSRPQSSLTPQGTGATAPGPFDHFLSGTKPETAATLAIGIGVLGAIWNLWRFLAALSPNDNQDAWQLRAFPWLQVGNILLGFAGLILYVGVLMGGLQLRQGQPGGARLLRASALGLLTMTGLWFVGALLAMMGSDRWEQIPDRYQASAVAGLLGTTLIAALLATFLVVVSRRRPD